MLARLRRLLMYTVLLLILMAGGVLVLYVIPRSTGDAFVGDMLRIDGTAMQARLCPDTTLAQVTGVVSAGGGEVGNLLAQLTGSPVSIPGRDILSSTLVPDAAYYPLTGAYVFHLRLGRNIELAGFKLDAGLNSPDITLTVGRRDVLNPCIHAG